MKCPHCSSIDTVWKVKAGKWECASCEERFDGDALENHASLSGARASLKAKAAKPKRIFFSYGHDANRELVDLFKTNLEERGHQVWIDYKEIGTWDDWKGSITRGIHDAEMAIAFLSIHSTRDPGVCRNEVAMALQHFGKVYPILVEQVPLENIPVTLTHLQWPDLSHWREFRDQEDLDFERFYEEKFLEILSRVEGEAGRFASEAEVLRRALNPSGFEGRFARHLDGFTGRGWVFDAFEHWLDHQPSSRVFWIKAGPGFGKTALAVQMANRHRAAIVGTWFCDHQSVELRDPLRALQTIAYQLALRWDDYRVRLLPRLGLFADSAPERIEEAHKELAKKSLQDLFSFLISEPLAGLIWREHKLVIMVDALDEAAEADGTNPLASLISGRFLELPEWIGFVVLSRPDASVLAHLQGFNPFAIEAADVRNTADLQSYAKGEIGPLLDGVDAAERERLCTLLVEKTAGMMLYLRLVSEGLREGTLTVGGLDSLSVGLPGLRSRYHAGFEARFGKHFHDAVQPLLRLIMAAPGPMPLDLAAEVLEWDRELAVRTRARVGSYIVEDKGCLSLFHKTLGEWLCSESAALYFTDPEPAVKRLGTFLWERFDEREKDANDLTKSFRWETLVKDWLPDLLEYTEKRNDWYAIQTLAGWFNEKILWGSAEILSRRALEGQEKILGSEHPDTFDSVNSLGCVLVDKSDYEGAEVLYRRALEGRVKVLGSEHPKTLDSVSNLGSVLRDKGDYEGAEVLCRRALEGREKVLGSEHPKTLDSVNNLGLLISDKGDYEGAEVLYGRALEGREKVFGSEHPDTLASVNNLGVLLRDKGDYEGAEVLCRRALEGHEKVFGSEHPKTLSRVNNLGVLLSDKGDYEGAEVLCRRALEVHEKVLGSEHPATLASVNNLGGLLRDKGDNEGAEVLYRRALEGHEKVLGSEHPKTLNSVNNLGTVLRDKGDNEGAEVLYRRALECHEKVFGSEHPKTLDSVNNLGLLLSDKGDYEGAEVLCRRALEGREKVLGSEHPATLNSVNNLGAVLRDKGDNEGAEALYRRALEGREKVFGSEHPDTLASVNNLGVLLSNKGDYEGAEVLYRRALEDREKVFGFEHPDTLASVDNLGLLLSDKGDYEGAEVLCRRALEGHEKVFGSEHPATLASVNNLGGLLRDKGDNEGAEVLYRRALEDREKVFGSEHPATLASVNNIGVLLRDKGDNEGAEVLYRRALEGREKVFGSEHPDTLDSVNNLGLLLRDKGDYDGAEVLYRRALEGREKVFGTEHSKTLSSAYVFGSILSRLGRRAEALQILRRFAGYSDKTRDYVAYNLACYECLEGNIDESKQLIRAHLEKHPNKKSQALADDDFLFIHDWISQLPIPSFDESGIRE